MPVNNTIQLRKGLSSEWASTNPVLASGEPGYDLTNNILKIGDGFTQWSGLNPVNLSGTYFNNAVSGLLPVKNIVAGSDISVSSISGIYTISNTMTSVETSSSVVTTVFNKTGASIPKMTAVYINGGQGDLPTIQKALATADISSAGTYGITYEAIDNMSSGRVIVLGALTGLNTDQFNPTAPIGDVNGSVLYLSPTVSGALTTTKPYAPYHIVAMGTIVRTHQNEGVIEVRVQNGYELEELHNVAVTGATNGQFLQYNSVSGLWVPSSSGNFTTLQVSGTAVPTGTGSANSITKWTGTNSLNNSIIYDNGTNIGIGTSSPSSKLDVSGVITATSGDSTNWNAAHGWGNHALQGYLTNISSQNIQDLNNVISDFSYPLLVDEYTLIYDSGISQFKGSTINLGLIRQGSIPLTGYSTSYLGYYIRMNNSEFTVNEQGANLDLRVEGDTDTNLLFTDASTDRVGIGTSSPSYKLDVVGTGNFSQNLLVNGTGVSLSGHTHSSSQITDFNSGVSGLLPVKDIIAGTGISIFSNNGNYTINSTSSGGAVSAEDVMDIIGTGIVAGTGLSVSYNDNDGNLTINLYAVAITGYEILTTAKDTFTVTPNYLVGNLQVYYNGFKLLDGEDYTATNGTSFLLSSPGASGDVVEWAGLGGPAQYAQLNHTHTISDITNFGSGVTGLLPTIANSGDNRILTSTGSSVGINAESNLTFDGSNLGIGTSSPTQRLQIHGSSADDVYLRISNTDTTTASGLLIGLMGTEDGLIRVEPNKALVFGTNNTERMRITSAGNVGIGAASTSPPEVLSVMQDNNGGRTSILIDNLDQRLKMSCYYEFGVGQYAEIQSTNNAETGHQALILNRQGGNVGIGTATVSYRLHVVGSASATNNITTYLNNTGGTRSRLAFQDTAVTYAPDMGSVGNNITFDTVGVERVRVGGNGRTQFFAATEKYGVQLNNGSTGNGPFLGSAGADIFCISTAGGAERFRVDANGNVLVGQFTTTDPAGANTNGVAIATDYISVSRSSFECLRLNLKAADGTIVALYQDAVLEGSISIAGNTVSYNAFCGSHWSQLIDNSKPEILRGTVLETLDETCEWIDGKSDRLVRVKISDIPKSKRVYGVFLGWDENYASTGDMYVAGLGAYYVRVKGIVQSGDLLESAGDGTAIAQNDDIVRSSTIGKVSSVNKITEYSDDSYLVACTLMCG